MTNDVTDAYLEKNPVQIDGLGFGSTSYAQCLRDEASAK